MNFERLQQISFLDEISLVKLQLKILYSSQRKIVANYGLKQKQKYFNEFPQLGNIENEVESFCRAEQDIALNTSWHPVRLITQQLICPVFHLENSVCYACESSLVSDAVNSEHVHTPFI